MNVADYIVAFLGSLGVRHVFGYPGSPLVPLLAALERQETVRFVLMRHESAAALAAGAHARLTGAPGPEVTTQTPSAPVSRAWAPAASAAALSWRMRTQRTVSWRSSAASSGTSGEPG